MFTFFKKKSKTEELLPGLIKSIEQLNRNLNYGGKPDFRTADLAFSEVECLLSRRGELSLLKDQIIDRYFEQKKPLSGAGLEYQKEKAQFKKMRDLLINPPGRNFQKTFDWIVVENRNIANDYKERQKQALANLKSSRPGNR